jgi:2-iminobutanoate/2-iminopropanoate deaminase
MKTPISTSNAPRPAAPYSQAIVQDGFVFVSGQGPLDPATGQYTPADFRTEARRTFDNVHAILGAAGSSLAQVVKVNVYLRDIADFAALNEVYATYFTAPYPARTTIQAGALPRGFAIEVECIARQ